MFLKMKKFFIVLFSLMFIFQPRPSFAGRKKYIRTKLSSVGKDIGDALKCAFNKNKCKEKNINNINDNIDNNTNK